MKAKVDCEECVQNVIKWYTFKSKQVSRSANLMATETRGQLLPMYRPLTGRDIDPSVTFPGGSFFSVCDVQLRPVTLNAAALVSGSPVHPILNLGPTR